MTHNESFGTWKHKGGQLSASVYVAERLRCPDCAAIVGNKDLAVKYKEDLQTRIEWERMALRCPICDMELVSITRHNMI